jgi:hypothetical protein
VVLEAAMEIKSLVPRNYLTTCKSYAFVQGWIGPPKQQPTKKKTCHELCSNRPLWDMVIPLKLRASLSQKKYSYSKGKVESA